MTEQSNHERAVELDHIKMQIEELLGQAEAIVKGAEDRSTYIRAEGYWLAHIKAALGDHGHFAMCTMRDTITELEEG